MSRLDELIQELCPDGVEYKLLQDLCLIKGRIGFRGYTKSDLVNKGDGAITLSPSNIIDGEINYSNCNYISWFKYEESPEIQVTTGDIIFCKTASVGKTALIKSLPEKATINPQLLVLKKIKCDSAFLSYVLKTDCFQDKVCKIKGLGTIPTISQKDFGMLEVPVPPMEVQHEIVRILDCLTLLRQEFSAELSAELSARRKQYEYYRNELLTFGDDVPRVVLPEISDNCDSQRKPVTKGKRETGEYPYYGASGIVDYVADYLFDGDYLLVSEDGANLRARVTPIAFSISGRTWVNNHAHILKFKNDKVQKFVEIYLNGIDLSPFISGGAQPKLNQANLNKIEIPFPGIDRITEIVSVLENFEALCNDISSGLPAEIEARTKQYEYYRDKLLSFKRKEAS